MTLEQFYWNTLYGGIILFHVLFGHTEKQILVYLYLSESINRTFFRRHFIRKICLAKDGHRFLNQLNFWEQTNFFYGKIRYRSEKKNWTFVQWEKERKKTEKWTIWEGIKSTDEMCCSQTMNERIEKKAEHA